MTIMSMKFEVKKVYHECFSENIKPEECAIIFKCLKKLYLFFV